MSDQHWTEGVSKEWWASCQQQTADDITIHTMNREKKKWRQQRDTTILRDWQKTLGKNIKLKIYPPHIPF